MAKGGGALRVADIRRLGQREMVAVSLLLTVAAALWGFVELADEVLEGSTEAVDRAVLLFFRVPGDLTDPIGPPWVELLITDTTALGGVAVLAIITVIVVGYLVVMAKRSAAVFVLVAIGGGTVVSFALKSLFERARPDLVPHGVEVATASFPSGHAMLSAVTYLTLGALLARFLPRRRAKAYVVTVAALLTLAIGVSRVYLGVHWPTDVLAGWTLGAAWAVLCWLVALWMQRHRHVETEAASDTDDA